MGYKNNEGYRDPTAGIAIHNSSRIVKEEKSTPAIDELVKIFKTTASLAGYDIVGRITFRDKYTGKEYR